MNNPFETLEKQLFDIKRIVIDLHKSKKDIPATDQWFDLNELVTYDPEKRTKATFYGYVHHNEIPYHKRGKKLTFLKSEIDEWLKKGRKKTIDELNEDVSISLKSK